MRDGFSTVPEFYLLIWKVTVKSKIVSTGLPCSDPGANCHCCTASSAACSNSPELLLTTFASRTTPVRSMMHSTMTKPFMRAIIAERGYGGVTRCRTIGAFTSPTPATSGPACATSVVVAGGPSPTPSGEPQGTPRGPVSLLPVLCGSIPVLVDAVVASVVCGMVLGATTVCGTGARCVCGCWGVGGLTAGLALGVPRAGGMCEKTGMVICIGA